jgi:hypothetical protein
LISEYGLGLGATVTYMVFGGTTEIQKEIIARGLGL